MFVHRLFHALYIFFKLSYATAEEAQEEHEIEKRSHDPYDDYSWPDYGYKKSWPHKDYGYKKDYYYR